MVLSTAPQPEVQPTSPIDISEFGPLNLVVIQPTSFCNLNCDYCYLPNRHLKKYLSPDLIAPISRAVFSSPFFKKTFTFCWHAGEPLAVPISFYRTAFAEIERQDQQLDVPEGGYNHSIQTNGTLITDAWCQLFKEYSVQIGVSIDGPAFLHNAHRKTRKGVGSHRGTMTGISRLQKHGIPFTTISVLTADSLAHPDEMFAFFLENGITDVGFNMEETEGVNTRSSLSDVGLETRYRAFIQRFWQLASEVQETFRVREFEDTCSLIYDDARLEHSDMNHPFRIVSFDHLGNFSTFDPELLSLPTQHYGDFLLGNIREHSLESVCDTLKFQQLYRDMTTGVALCRQSCPYFGLCGGGAGSNKYWENGTFASAETSACRYRIKAITDIVVGELERSTGLSPARV
ncbi:MAG: cyclophane-forming radical SAM/SPASM peptide maturase GrrM/OscB [Cyanobacteria bacterium P01_H01_bin.15]